MVELHCGPLILLENHLVFVSCKAMVIWFCILMELELSGPLILQIIQAADWYYKMTQTWLSMILIIEHFGLQTLSFLSVLQRKEMISNLAKYCIQTSP